MAANSTMKATMGKLGRASIIARRYPNYEYYTATYAYANVAAAIYGVTVEDAAAWLGED